MSFFDGFKQWLLRLELSYVRRNSFLDDARWLHPLNRKITADITVDRDGEKRGVHFRIDFRTPYLRLPVAIEKSQIGRLSKDGTWQAGSFRFFDWHSWAHINGDIQWHGECCATRDLPIHDYATGFSYTVTRIPLETENLGIRLAEGTVGTVKVFSGTELVQCRFEPGYWMLEPAPSGYKIVAINNTELMVLIVSLSEIGSGNERLRDAALKNLHQWVLFKLDKRDRELMLLEFLRYVRDWGPLGMEPLYPGLVELLKRLRLDHLEHVIYEFYADNWGVRNNWQGRLLAVRILEMLATRRSATALHSIFEYVRNRDIQAEELDTICKANRRVSEKTDRPQAALHL